MQALAFTRAQETAFIERPVPPPAPSEVLLRNFVTGVVLPVEGGASIGF